MIRIALCCVAAFMLVILGTLRPVSPVGAAPEEQLNIVVGADAAGHLITCTNFSVSDPTRLAPGAFGCQIDMAGAPANWAPSQLTFAWFIRCTKVGESGTCTMDPANGSSSLAQLFWTGSNAAGTFTDQAQVTKVGTGTGTLIASANGLRIEMSGNATLSQAFADGTFISSSVPWTMSIFSDFQGRTSINFSPGPLCTGVFPSSCGGTWAKLPWVVACNLCVYVNGVPWGATNGTVTPGTGSTTPTPQTTPVPATPIPPTGPQILTGTTRSGEPGTSPWFRVIFNSQGIGRGTVLFGSGPGCLGLIGTATTDQFAGTTRHSVLVTQDELHPGFGLLPGRTYWFEMVTVTSTGTEIDNNGGKCYSVTMPSA